MTSIISIPYRLADLAEDFAHYARASGFEPKALSRDMVAAKRAVTGNLLGMNLSKTG